MVTKEVIIEEYSLGRNYYDYMYNCPLGGYILDHLGIAKRITIEAFKQQVAISDFYSCVESRGRPLVSVVDLDPQSPAPPYTYELPETIVVALWKLPIHTVAEMILKYG